MVFWHPCMPCRQVLGQVGRDLHVSQQHLPRWPWLAKQRFFGVVFEKQWTSLALPATGLQFLAGNGPLIFGTFTDQACSSPTFATPKRPTLGRESPQTCKPPTHLATSASVARHHGALQRPMQGTWFGPQILRVGHFAHSTAVSPLMPHLAAPAHLAQGLKHRAHRR